MEFIKKNKKGFTLIELLVVIAIIGVLSSIAVINLSNGTKSSKKVAMLKQSKNIVPLVDFCVSNNQVVCSDCDFWGGSMYTIATGKQICNGQYWPEPIKGWNWGVYTYDSSNQQWSFGSLDGTGASITCSNVNNKTNCILFQP